MSTRHSEMFTKSCKVCDKEFTVNYCFKKQFCCSDECARASRRKPKVKITCVQCSTVVLAFPSEAKAGRRFCSRKCATEWTSGPNHHAWKPDRFGTCTHCGSSFEADKPWKRVKKFCSYPCCVAYRIKNGGPSTVPVGTKSSGKDGYIVVKVENGDWIPEHRIVAEQKIGRKLEKGEVVHHINNVPTDNRPENLLVMSDVAHRKLHHELGAIGLSFLMSEAWMPSIEGMAC